MDPSPLRRVEPPAATIDAVRAWLAPIRAAMGPDFLSAYLTGSVLTSSFDPKHSRINVLVIARALGTAQIDVLASAIPRVTKPPLMEPLFLTRSQIEHSLDVFPIEWIEIQERHLLLEGDDLVARLNVSHANLRLECEHELRGKHIQLRQGLLRFHADPKQLEHTLAAAASSFATVFRTLLRLRGETPPAETADVVMRVADTFKLDAQALLGAHLVRTAGDARRAQVPALYRSFVAEVDRLVTAIDELRVP